MVQRKARHAFKDEAERRFPHKIDIPVPELGLGRDLTAMLEWCPARVPEATWVYHGHTERPSKREAPMHCARWYFASQSRCRGFPARLAGARLLICRLRRYASHRGRESPIM
jgi:hypothetical protein